MRAVLFEFYTIETLMNMVLTFFNIHGFLTKPLDFLPLREQYSHYFYFISIYIFVTVTLFASINICTGHKVMVCEEIVRNLVGFLLFTGISIMTLGDAEKDFHLMYIMGTFQLAVEKPVHPFFKYLRAQAICALVCGVAYLLHAIIMIDVLLSNEENFLDTTNDNDENVYEDSEYIPVRLYVLGDVVQSYLEKKDWFIDFNHNVNSSI